MALDLLDIGGGIAELIDWLRGAFAGWRYLLSPTYRQRIHSGWKSDAWYYVAGDVICGVAGVLFSLFLLYVIISLFAGFDWPARLANGT